MRLAEIHIEGFGRFHHFSLRDIHPGLSVVSGQNEAGKSTLLAFLRSILFGFADRRSNTNTYPPLQGGRKGGRIVMLCGASKRYTIERFEGRAGGAVRVILPDGSEGGADMLQQLIGSASQSLFQNVFAFSLTELQELKTLNTDSVRDSIYSAGVGGGPATIQNALRVLKERQDALFVPRGRGQQTINGLLPLLDDIQTRIKERRGGPQQHEELRSKLAGAEKSLAQKESACAAAREQLDRIKVQLRAWNEWAELLNQKQALAALQLIDSFPEDGMQRLKDLDSERRNITDQLAEAAAEKTALAKKLADIHVDSGLLHCTQRIRALDRARDGFERDSRNLSALEAECKLAEESLSASLRNLGSGWDEAKLLSTDVSEPVRMIVQNHRQVLQNAEHEIVTCQRRLEDSRRVLENFIEAEERAQQALNRRPELAAGAALKGGSSITGRRGMLRKLRALLAERKNIESEGAHIDQRRDDLEERLSRLEQDGVQAELLAAWPGIVLLAGGCVALLLAGLLWSWTAAIVALVFFGTLCAGYSILRRLLSLRQSQRRESLEADERKVKAVLNDLQTQANACRGNAATMKKEFSELAQTIGLSPGVSEQELDNAEAELNQAHELQIDREKLIGALADVSELRKKQEQKTDSIQRDLGEKTKLRDVAHADWRKWLATARFNESLTPNDAIGLLEKAGLSLTRLESLKEKRLQLTTTRQALDGYAEQVRAVCETLQRNIPGGLQARAGIAGETDKLSNDLLRAEDAQRAAMNIREGLEKCQKRIETLSGKLQRRRQDIQALLDAGGAASEENFRSRAASYAQQRELQDCILAGETRLRQLAPGDDALSMLKAELSQSSPAQLEKSRLEFETQINALEEARTAGTAECAELRLKLTQLEESLDTSKLLMEEQIRVAELRAAAREWSVLGLASHLITLAREKYERERRPAVLKEAERFFARLTGGRYTEVIAPPGESLIQVRTRDSVTVDVDALSRGTAEQLYLALRFGFVQEFAKRSEPLPLVFDDILVNFDPKRAQAALEAIIELSQKHQVLLFTCHPSTGEMVKRLAPQTPILDLANVPRANETLYGSVLIEEPISSAGKEPAAG